MYANVVLPGGPRDRRAPDERVRLQLIDDGSRVQQVLIKSAEQRRTQSLSMRRREKTCTGDKDHDVELFTATHMNPHHSETYRRNTRDRLHVEIDVRTTTAKDTTSVMAKLMHGCD